jgi:hypothetical protein
MHDVFLEMGDANEIIHPYCSALFRYNPGLDPHAARPAECALQDSGISSQASGAPGSAS